jgi:hypothetical protein
MLYYAALMDETNENAGIRTTNADLAPYVEGFGRVRRLKM